MIKVGFKLCLSLLLLLLMAVSYADEKPSEAKLKHKQQIEQVLKNPEFGETKTSHGWRLKDREDKEKREELFPDWLINFFEFIEANKKGIDAITFFLEILLWVGVGLLIFWLIYRFREQLSDFVQSFSEQQQERELPTTLFGLDVKTRNLPKDVLAEAKAAWRSGDKRAAMAVLLQASLIKLLFEHDCYFSDSDTESECCRRIDQQTGKSVASYMRSLVSVWQQLAYAHKQPTDDTFQQLCQGWQEVF